MNKVVEVGLLEGFQVGNSQHSLLVSQWQLSAQLVGFPSSFRRRQMIFSVTLSERLGVLERYPFDI